MKYKFLSHTADIKFQAFGNSLNETFENSFYCLKEIIADKIKIKENKKIKIKIKGSDLKELLHNFLEEILFLLDAKDFIASGIKNIKVNEDKFELICEFIGDKASNYNISNDVKAITYNDMRIAREKGKFLMQVVVDV